MSTIAALVVALFGAVSTCAAASVSDSPIGLWKAFDDRTGKPGATLRVYEREGVFFGRIEQIFSGDEHQLCTACVGERKNQPMVGLVIIRNMRPANGGYEGGDILDPRSGISFRCKFHLSENGSRLVVRGFIGIPLLGRSQTWERQD